MTSILPVAQQGEAILNLIAQPVSAQEFSTAWLDILCKSLYATLMQRHGVGIAAPQVYVSKRVIIVASKPNIRYPDAPELSPIVMINPEILSQSEEKLWGEEGCLSVPDQRGQVARAAQIHVRYYSVDGQCSEVTLSGFPARIVQHEIDHLNGILFVDRLDENTTL